MSEDYNSFSSFKEMIEQFRADGFEVIRVNEDAAVVLNNGRCNDYTGFDTTVSTVTFNNGFNFKIPANAKVVHEKTVNQDKNPSEMNEELYLGIYQGDDDSVLENSNYEFKSK